MDTRGKRRRTTSSTVAEQVEVVALTAGANVEAQTQQEVACHDRFVQFPRPATEAERYNVIYADPAWSYNDFSPRGVGLHYDLMSKEDLEAMPVRELAARDCILFMWATYPKLQQALDLVKAWGFKYKTVAFTWVKLTKGGDYTMGMGRWTRSNAEICLLASRGRPKRFDASVSQIVAGRRREHSRKPDEVRGLIERLCGPNVRRIELFARERTPGWDVWGNDVPAEQ